MKKVVSLALIGAGLFGLYKAVDGYLNRKLEKAGIYPIPEMSLADKIRLIKHSPYKPKKYQV